MDKKFIDKVIQIMGEETALKAVCNITERGSIDETIHKQKINRARMFGLIEEESLTLTELGKLFAAKILLDMAENVVEKSGVDDKDDIMEENDEENDFEEIDNLNDWSNLGEDDWTDEDWDSNDWSDEDDSFSRNRGGRRKRN